jgi:hypothetical protein
MDLVHVIHGNAISAAKTPNLQANYPYSKLIAAGKIWKWQVIPSRTQQLIEG